MPLFLTHHNPVYLKDFGFFEEVKKWKATNLSSILNLATVPSQAQEDVWKKGSAPWKVEKFLQQVYKMAGKYLLGAKEIIEGHHPVLRKILIGANVG
jgi:hypothetical protein